ncbi:interleukin-8-like [Mastacembelus armatus]|uniref:Interleukin-8-like n=1 Tax=Mastacembelus armatus TaxID=205130 RepID=A0A3Q3RHC3_9TELE|nr:interleukin-8-like [Mastacembelus armatus]
MSVITTVALLLFLIIPEGISQGDQGLILRCRCITKEKKPIGRFIRKMEVFPASSHCEVTEIIATLKQDGQKICLDPDAPWIQKLLQKKKAKRTPRRKRNTEV